VIIDNRNGTTFGMTLSDLEVGESLKICAVIEKGDRRMTKSEFLQDIKEFQEIIKGLYISVRFIESEQCYEVKRVLPRPHPRERRPVNRELHGQSDKVLEDVMLDLEYGKLVQLTITRPDKGIAYSTAALRAGFNRALKRIKEDWPDRDFISSTENEWGYKPPYIYIRRTS